MIKPAEIQQIARKEGVRDAQIEKDYVISWILITWVPFKLFAKKLEVYAIKGRSPYIEEHLIEKIQQESRFFTETKTSSEMKLTPSTQWA